MGSGLAGRVWVAGHSGLVGSALVRRLEREPGVELLLRSHADLDLTDRVATRDFVRDARPDVAIIAAARVGGIAANMAAPYEFLAENLAIAANCIGEAEAAGVGTLVFLGSSCVYPRDAQQPIVEGALLTGPLEPTNEGYAVAKIAGIRLCDAVRAERGLRYFSVMPCNLYGPNDSFDLETAHALPALLRRFHEAKEAGAEEVVVWGSGRPRREFLHADDVADAIVHLLGLPTCPGLVNIGAGEDLTIADLAARIAGVVGFDGELRFDPTRPDGVPRKLLDVSLIRGLRWKPSIRLEEGIRQTYEWSFDHV